MLQDPKFIVPSADALQYGMSGLLYVVIVVFASAGVLVGFLLTRVLSKIGHGIESSIDKQAAAVDKQAAAIEKQSIEQRETNLQLRSLVTQTETNTEKVLKQHETSTALILERLPRRSD